MTFYFIFLILFTLALVSYFCGLKRLLTIHYSTP